MNLWIVGKSAPNNDAPWEFVGAFDSKDKAIAACKDWQFFIGPAVLNEVTPEERMTWPGCYYPHAGAVV